MLGTDGCVMEDGRIETMGFGVLLATCSDLYANQIPAPGYETRRVGDNCKQPEITIMQHYQADK
jgi:hypothetical protein